MNWVTVILVMVLTFGLCFLLDKGFSKIFRGKAQHQSGRAVKLNRKYGAAGVILAALGVAAILSGLNGSKVLLWGGVIVALLGVALAMYYLTFGVYYDDDTFLLTTFGKKSKAYTYGEIVSQQLFTSAGGILVELYLADGRSVGLQAQMEGTYEFLDAAFAGWCRQTGRNPEDCDFHDPQNSLWFPAKEG